MIKLTRINHIGLRVRDLAISRAFYEILGFEFVIGPVGPEPVAVMEHPAGININFVLNASDDACETNILMDVPVKHAGFNHIALEVSDMAAVLRALADNKIAITGGPITTPGGTKMVFVRDPDLNVIEFHQPG